MGKRQSSVPENFLYQTFGSWKYRGSQNNWGGKGLWSGLDEVAQGHVQRRLEWLQAWRSNSLPGLPHPRLITPMSKKDFLAYLLIFLWLLTSSPFLCLKKKVGMLGPVLIWWRPVLSLTWWGSSEYQYWLAVLGRWELSLMPEMLLKCPLLNNIFPPTNAWFMAGVGSHFFTQRQAALSLLSTQRPPFNQLTKKRNGWGKFLTVPKEAAGKISPLPLSALQLRVKQTFWADSLEEGKKK